MLKTSQFKKILIHLVLIIGVIFTVFPFLWMILTSLKTLSESMAIPPVILPSALQWSNFSVALKKIDFILLYKNLVCYFYNHRSGSYVYYGRLCLCKTWFPIQKHYFYIDNVSLDGAGSNIFSSSISNNEQIEITKYYNSLGIAKHVFSYGNILDEAIFQSNS